MDPFLDMAPCGFLSFADDGTILVANATLSRWLDYNAGELDGRSVESVLPMASRIFYQTHFFPLLKLTGEVEEVYITLRTAQGDELPMLVNASRREQNGVPVNDAVFMVVRQRSRYEDEILAARRTTEEARLWLSTTLQSIGDAVIATDAEGRVVFLNPVAEELTGWPQQEAVGRPLDEIFVIVNEETRLPVESPVAKVLREKRVVGLANHTLLIARDGLHRPIDDSGAPIRNTAGEILGIVLVFRDFTEQRHAEQVLREQQARIETLNQHLQRAMTETHHRVKNNLQLISALIDLQKGTDREMVPMSEFRRIGQSIGALGVVHDILTKEAQLSDGERTVEFISAREVLARLLPMMEMSLGAKQLNHTLDDVRLPGKQVTAITLLTNELVSNAIKHGNGQVEVHFHVVENTAFIDVLDDGPGFPESFDPVRVSNTGLDLIENIARWDLQGTTAYATRAEGGGRVTISFPLPSSEPPVV